MNRVRVELEQLGDGTWLALSWVDNCPVGEVISVSALAAQSEAREIAEWWTAEES